MRWPDWLTRRKHPYPDALAVLGLLAISLVLFSDTVIPLRALLYCGDFMEHYAYEFAVRTGLAHGTVPLWNPYFAEPLAGTPQSELFYPGMAVLRWIPLPWAFAWSMRLHVWLAGLGVFALLRDLNTRRSASMLGAVAYMLSTSLTEHLVSGHVAMVNVMVWVPWIVLFYRRLLLTRRWRYVVATALAVCTYVLAGHLQWVLIGILTPVGFGVFMLAETARLRDWRGLRDSAAATAAMAALAAGALAVYALPVMDYWSMSPRSAGLSYDEATAYSLEPAQLLTLPSPLVRIAAGGVLNGSDEALAYSGLIAVGLAALALFSPNPAHRKTARLLAVLDIVALAISLGGHTPAYRPVYAIADFMRAPSRFTLIWALCTPLLAAIGLEGIFRRIEAGLPGRTWALWASVGVSAAVVALGLTGPVARPAVMVMAVMAVVVWAVALAARRWLPISRWGWVLVAAMIFDMGSFTWMVAGPGILNSIEYYDLFFHPESNPYLALRIDPAQTRLWGGDQGEPWAVAPAFGVPVLGRSAQVTSRYVLDMLALGPKGAALGASGYQIVTGMPPAGASIVRTVGQTSLVELPGNLPRVYATGEVRVVKDVERSLRRMTSRAYDPLMETVVIDPDGQFDAAPFEGRGGPAEYNLRVLDFQSELISVRVEADRSLMVVFVEPYYPGWKADIDGSPARIWQVNHAFRGVVVPGGTHTVTLTYQPDSVRYGAWISGVSLLVVTLITVWVVVKRPDRL